MIADGRRRLRVAVLFSRRAPGVEYLLDADPNHGLLYDIVGCITSEPDSGEAARISSHGVPVAVHDIRAFYRERGRRLSDPEARTAFDAATLRLLEPLAPDLVVLCAYLYRLQDPLLARFPGRIVNIHDSDLRLRRADGSPRFPGLHAVRDAILAGEAETRSTVHLVTPELDAGPVVVVSRAFPVHQRLVRECGATAASDALRAYAFAQREWMMAVSWGPLLSKALERTALHPDRRGSLAAVASGSGLQPAVTEP